MALQPIGILDLSIITDRLVELLTDCCNKSPLWTETNPKFTLDVTGAAPETTRSDSECQLNLYLFHVSQDRYQRNSAVSGTRERTPLIPFQPLSLELYFLVTAFAKADYVKEQQAMSIALRCFHEHPIVSHTVVINGTDVDEEFCISMEVESADMLSRIWQATTAPHRLSAVYKASVIFITPPAPTRGLAPRPTTVHLSADPAALPLSGTGQVVGTLRVVSYVAPGSGAAGVARSYDLSPATVAAGDSFVLLGAGLNQATSQEVYLLQPNGVEQNVSAWKAPDPGPPDDVLQTSSRITLCLPATAGAPPTHTPPPGIYQLRVGVDGATPYRSNATPFSIAARVAGPGGGPPLPAPVLVPAAGLFTLNGVGFSTGQTGVLLDTVALEESPGAPGAGEFAVNAAGTALTFRKPAGLPAGRYTVRVLVNGVESTPAWWVEAP
jgi:hypothetical protein